MINTGYSNAVKELSELNMGLDGHPFDEEINELDKKILSNQYKIAVVGDFSTGKSTFINALIGEELLYSATKESTGVVTTLQYDENKYADICIKVEGELEKLEKIDLDEQEGIQRLNQYLDIENKNKVDQVNIFYPIERLEKDIVFFDTPGIEKSSKEQMLMTKQVITVSNAVIFLITKKGFTDPALKVITGEHEIIGEIPKKDMFVVMTHTGEVYEDRSQEEAERQIERLCSEAREQLQQKNLDTVKIIPVDSRDYLWGVNNNVYDRAKKKRDVRLNGLMLEQDEYRNRSKFEEFKKFLYGFLDRDHLEESREADIINMILRIAEAMELEISKTEEAGERDRIRILDQIEKQIETACGNQRKFYNRLIRQLQEHMTDFLENVERDIQEIRKSNTKVLNLINETFKSLEDINEENVEKCVEAQNEELDRFAKKIEKETNDHVGIMLNNFVENVFSEQFQQIFKKSIDVRFDIQQPDFNLVLEKDEDDYDVSKITKDMKLDEMNEEKGRLQREIYEIEEEIKEVEGFCNRKMQSEHQMKREKLEQWYDGKMLKLGTRPKKKQKYKEVTRTKGHLFWKKTWTAKVPDGMDDSAGKVWDKRNREIMDEYNRRLDELDKETNDMEDKERMRNQLGNLLEEKTKKMEHQEDKIRRYNEFVEEGKKKYADEYTNEKKEDVAVFCDSLRTSMLDQVLDCVQEYIRKSKKSIDSSIKKELNLQIENYRKELWEKNEALCESIKVSEETNAALLNRLKNIKENASNG